MAVVSGCTSEPKAETGHSSTSSVEVVAPTPDTDTQALETDSDAGLSDNGRALADSNSNREADSSKSKDQMKAQIEDGVGAAQQGMEQRSEDEDQDGDSGFDYEKLIAERRQLGGLPPIPDGFVRLDPEQEVWLSPQEKQVLVGGRICKREGYLEFFACKEYSKEHESVVAVIARPSIVHAALLAVGAEPGGPVTWNPEFKPAHGPKVKIDVIFLDENKELKTTSAQKMILDTRTNEALEVDWVFGGSQIVKDPEDGREYYMGDGGDLICVSNFTTATMDLPIESSDIDDFRVYVANPAHIPPLETRVLLRLTPEILEKE